MKRILQIAGAFLISGATVYANAQSDAAALYKANCAMCHGATGAADTPAGKNFKVPAFSSESVLKESDAELLAIAKNGKGKMKAYKQLSDADVKALVAYVRSLKK